MYRGKVPENRAKFYGMITNIDENVGGLRRRLEELGLADNTLFVFMTDNGTAEGCGLDADGFVTEGYNSGMRGKKSSPYDGGHRVPFFLHWPGGGYTTGKNIDSLTSYVDFMPTLIELCQLTIPSALAFDGTSLVPLLGAAEPQPQWAERAVVTDSQRVPAPIKWRASAVMCGRWRLINGQELYRIDSDPEQRYDIAGLHPDVVEKLRLDYEGWWEKVSRQFNEEIPISIGSACEPVTRINSHDWRGDVGDCAWNQGEIRAGKICNSYVEVDIETDGLYAFELRRWPEEEGSDITAGLPGELQGWFSGGKALPIIKASISVQNFEAISPVTDEDQQITFTAELTAGTSHLQTYLEDTEGNIRGAYYVYVRKL